jgi:hypothetical protein
VLLTLEGGVLSAESLDGELIDLSIDVENISYVNCQGNDFAYLSPNYPDKVFMSNLELSGALSYQINASAEEDVEQVLADWDTPVDIENATITNIVFDKSHLLVSVNLSSVDRIVLVDRESTDYRLLGDGKYSSYDPSIRDGIVAWAMKDHLNPSSPIEEYFDGEIFYMDIAENFTHVLTADEVDQWGPIVLEDHLVYFEESNDGVIIQVHSWEPELKSYSNIILQSGSVIGIMLIFVYINQRQSEIRTSKFQSEEE